MEKSPQKLKFLKNPQGRAHGRARVRGEGREGKSAQGRAPSPKKGSCALWANISLNYQLWAAMKILVSVADKLVKL